MTGTLASRLAQGDADEDEAAQLLTALGWRVELFGQRIWKGLGLGDSDSRLRHAPDLAIASDARTYLVEVVRVEPRSDCRPLGLAKLAAFDHWAHIAPVVWLDVWPDVPVAWWHRPNWPHVMRRACEPTATAPGLRFAMIPRQPSAEHAYTRFFGRGDQ